MRRLIAGVTGVLIAGMLLLAGSAGVGSTTKTGPERWTIIGANFQPGHVVAQGLINAIGAAHDNFVLLPNGTFTNVAHQTYPLGTITLSSAGVQQFDFHLAACTGVGTFTGTFKVIGGTGAYAGITGGGTISGRVTVINGVTPTGCTAQPIQVVAGGPAVGEISLP